MGWRQQRLPLLRPRPANCGAGSLRPGHELTYYPGETNSRLADVFVINKVDTADYENVLSVRENLHSVNPNAVVIEAAARCSWMTRKPFAANVVLVIEDGPTLTHGGMKYGAAWVAARRFGAAEIVDPRPYAVGSIKETYEKYPETGPILPAMGYGKSMMKDLEKTIDRADVDIIVSGTPIDITRVVKVKKPMQRVALRITGNRLCQL